MSSSKTSNTANCKNTGNKCRSTSIGPCCDGGEELDCHFRKSSVKHQRDNLYETYKNLEQQLKNKDLNLFSGSLSGYQPTKFGL